MKLPIEMALWHEDTNFRVRFDYEPGEAQWFDHRAGVGGPGYDPSVAITEVNFGKGWESPDAYPQLNMTACEQEVMEKLAEIDECDRAAREDAEYMAWQEREQ